MTQLERRIPAPEIPAPLQRLASRRKKRPAKWDLPRDGMPCALCEVVDARPDHVLSDSRFGRQAVLICNTCRVMWAEAIGQAEDFKAVKAELRAQHIEWFTRDEWRAPESWDDGWYRGYLTTPAWRRRRAACSSAAEDCCEYCQNRRRTQLDAHHLTYDRLGHERPDDLVMLCRPCHAAIHGEESDVEPDEAIRGVEEQAAPVAPRTKPASDDPGELSEVARDMDLRRGTGRPNSLDGVTEGNRRLLPGPGAHGDAPGGRMAESPVADLRHRGRRSHRDSRGRPAQACPSCGTAEPCLSRVPMSDGGWACRAALEAGLVA